MQELKAKEIFAVFFTFGVLSIIGASLIYNDKDVSDQVEKIAYAVVSEQHAGQVEQSALTQSNQDSTNQLIDRQTVDVNSSH